MEPTPTAIVIVLSHLHCLAYEITARSYSLWLEVDRSCKSSKEQIRSEARFLITEESESTCARIQDGGRAPARYVSARSWPVEPSDIVDTTGAGDSFIAGFIYGLTHRLGIAR